MEESYKILDRISEKINQSGISDKNLKFITEIIPFKVTKKISDDVIDDLIKIINIIRIELGQEVYPTYTPVTLYGSITSNGDGSASINFFLNKESAEKDQEISEAGGGWGEPCYKDIVSFTDSDEYDEALRNEEEIIERWKEFKEEYPD